jgi:hypothetical protein
MVPFNMKEEEASCICEDLPNHLSGAAPDHNETRQGLFHTNVGEAGKAVGRMEGYTLVGEGDMLCASRYNSPGNSHLLYGLL